MSNTNMTYEEIQAALKLQYAAHKQASEDFCREADLADTYEDAPLEVYSAHRARLQSHETKMNNSSDEIERLKRLEQIDVLGLGADDLQSDA